jgi:hypothetical protein
VPENPRRARDDMMCDEGLGQIGGVDPFALSLPTLLLASPTLKWQ